MCVDLHVRKFIEHSRFTPPYCDLTYTYTW